MTDMAQSVMAGTATVDYVTDLQCLQTFSKVMLVPYGNLFLDTFKFRCKKIGINEMKTSEHDVSN